MALYTRDFSGTDINTPFDQMRANAMINARHDTRGTSIINFNINAFLQKARHNDLYYILSMWAVEPINRSPAKFRKHPEAGKRALYKRIESLKNNFYSTRNIADWFTDTAYEHMMIAVDNEIALIQPNLRDQQMRYA